MSILDKCNGPILTSTASIEFKDLKKKYVGFVFAAKWCPYCTKFMPKLIEYCNKNPLNMDIIYASNDSTAVMLDDFRKDMPWFSFPFKDTRIKELAQFHAINVIPSLTIYERATGKLISNEGKGDMNALKIMEDLKEMLGKP